MWIPRREAIVILICLVPFLCYVVYILELQNSSIMLAREFGANVNLREQVDLLYSIGNLEMGVLGVGLAASASSYYKAGSIDRRLLIYTLASILVLVSVIAVRLNMYYQYIVNLLGL